MTIRVRLSDGRIAAFPEGTPPEQIEAVLRTSGVVAPLEMGAQEPDAARPVMLSPRERGAERARQEVESGFASPLAESLLAGATLGLSVPVSAAADVASATIGRFLGAPEERLPPAQFGEALEFERGRLGALREAAPGASLAGGLIGGLAGGGAVSALARGAARVSPLAARAVETLTPRAGQFLRNTARAATTGAAVGATQAGVEQGAKEIPRGAVIGAVAAPVLGGIVSGGVAAARRIREAFKGDRTSAAFRVLSRTLRRPVEDIEDAVTAFTQRFGRAPRLTEIATEAENRELARIAQTRGFLGQLPEAPATLVSGELERIQQLPRDLQRAAFGREATKLSPAAVMRIRGERGDIEFGRFAKRRLTLTDDLKQFLEDPDFRVQLTRGAGKGEGGTVKITTSRLKNQLARVISGDRPVTAGFLENLRQASAEEGFKDQVRSFIAEQVPEFRQALTRSATLAQFSEGLEAAPGLLAGRTPSLREALRSQPGARAESRRAGMRAGVVQSIEQELGGTPEQALAAANRFRASPELRERVAIALGVPAAQRLRGAGEEAVRIARSTRPIRQLETPSISEQEAQQLADIANLTFVGQGGGAFRANLAAQFARRLKLSPATATRIAELAASPTTFPNAIAALRRAGVQNRTLVDIFARSVPASAVFAAEQSSQR